MIDLSVTPAKRDRNIKTEIDLTIETDDDSLTYNPDLLKEVLNHCKLPYRTESEACIHVVALDMGCTSREDWHTISWEEPEDNIGARRLCDTIEEENASKDLCEANSALVTVSFIPLTHLSETPAFVIWVNKGQVVHVLRNDTLHLTREQKKKFMCGPECEMGC